MNEGSEIREAVLASAWPWKTETGNLDSSGRIRLGALGQGLIGGAVGAVVYFFYSTTIGMVAWGISSVIALVGLASPTGLYAKISAGLEAFGRLVGTFLTWLLLVPVYYLFFTPFRLIFRRGKNDALTRWLDRETDTYWVLRPDDQPSSESYERQF